MFSSRPLARLAVACAALAVGLPAAAGTLSPQLRTLLIAYQKSPQATLAQAVGATRHSKVSRAFAPHVNAAGQVQVYLYYRQGERPTSAALAGLSADKVLVSPPLGIVQAWLPIGELHAAAALAGVSRVALPVYGRVKGHSERQPREAACDPVPEGLDINRDGIDAQNVEPLHKLGVTGKGVKVGIISDGAECRAVSQARGYLPEHIFVAQGGDTEEDEGTAMMEEVHAIAPDAALGTCGPETSVEFLSCMEQFAQWGAGVISDDLEFPPAGYNFGPFINPDTGKNVIVEFADAHPDISLVMAAGNDGEDFYAASYKATAQPVASSIGAISLAPDYTVPAAAEYMATGRTYTSAMDFGAALDKPDDAAIAVTVPDDTHLDTYITWNDPADGPWDDVDFFLLDANGHVACKADQDQHCASTRDQMTYAGKSLDPPFQRGLPPLEQIAYDNESGSPQTLYLVALCYDCSAHGSEPLHLKVYGGLNGGGTFNYITDGGIPGQAQLRVEIAAAAARYEGDGESSMEPYSDTGPFAYGNWLNGAMTRSKPDITGIDAVTVSGAGGFPSPFHGTSAASPNVAGVIALLRGAFPDSAASAKEWKAVIQETASVASIVDYRINASGPGLVDASAAAASLDPPVSARITAPVDGTTTVPVDTAVSFKGECSYAGKFPLSHQWSFGEGSGVPDSAKLNPPAVRFTHPGTYTVRLTCSDGLQSASTTATVRAKKLFSSGGGAFGVFGLALLSGLVLLALRRKR
jgi:hypothetical protein